MERKIVKIGTISIGKPNEIIVQSMTNTKTEDVKATLGQIQELYAAGCQMVRVTVPNNQAVAALTEIVKESPVPIIADLHYDQEIILKTLDTNVAKIRVNPGTLKGENFFEEIVRKCKKNKTVMRIGVNAGSLHPDFEEQYQDDIVSAMFKSLERYVAIAEKLNFFELVLSAKSSNVLETIEVNRLLYEKLPYPLHIGVTEAGTLLQGAIKNAVGISALLSQNIGNTIRVSLTANPVEEVKVANQILSELGYRKKDVEIISCPTCGRTNIELQSLVEQLEQVIEADKEMFQGLKIAIMGCVVNGPGEAKHADYGITGGAGKGIIFKNGVVIKTVLEKELISELVKLIELDRGAKK